MRVLIVKTSSMGDVIHTLPAITDALNAKKSITFDWVVEENFAEIPSWHPGVDQVIPVAIRRWRKQPFSMFGSAEWKDFKRSLRKNHYDLVIDAQGLLKSAWLTRYVKAPVAGYNKDSVREKIASFFYRYKFNVDKNLHAVERIRELFAQALNYEKPETKGDYGLNASQFFGSSKESDNVVFLHGTTRDNKHYPEVYWQQLATKLTEQGYRVRLPWGTEIEQQRAERIAADRPNVDVLPRLNIHGVASVLAQANAVVAVDTGLGHLAAALNIPAVSLYGPTKPGLIGAYGEHQIHLCSSDYDASEIIAAGNTIEPEIFTALTPEIVDHALSTFLVKPEQGVCS